MHLHGLNRCKRINPLGKRVFAKETELDRGFYAITYLVITIDAGAEPTCGVAVLVSAPLVPSE
jgi:hypothetical protein